MSHSVMAHSVDIAVRRPSDDEDVEDVVEVAVTGVIDIAAVNRLAPVLHREISARPDGISVVLAEVGLLSAHGVRVLLRARRLAREHGVRFTLGRCSSQVQRVLTVCGVGDLVVRPAERLGRADSDSTARLDGVSEVDRAPGRQP